MKKGKIIIKILWLSIMIFGLLLGTLLFTLSLDNSFRIFIQKVCYKYTSLSLMQSFNWEVQNRIEKFITVTPKSSKPLAGGK